MTMTMTTAAVMTATKLAFSLSVLVPHLDNNYLHNYVHTNKYHTIGTCVGRR